MLKVTDPGQRLDFETQTRPPCPYIFTYPCREALMRRCSLQILLVGHGCLKMLGVFSHVTQCHANIAVMRCLHALTPTAELVAGVMVNIVVHHQVLKIPLARGIHEVEGGAPWPYSGRILHQGDPFADSFQDVSIRVHACQVLGVHGQQHVTTNGITSIAEVRGPR